MYKCDVCEKEFKSHRQLNGHKSVHREGGRYSVSRRKKEATCCPKCNTLTFNPKYCSNKCQREHEWDLRFEQITNGEVFPEQQMKRYLLETRGEKCEHCGIGSEWNGKPLTLQMDHIDGNSDNNTLDNLQILCPNCHTQTHTWCGRNKKNTKRNKYNRIYRTRVLNSVGRVHPLHG